MSKYKKGIEAQQEKIDLKYGKNIYTIQLPYKGVGRKNDIKCHNCDRVFQVKLEKLLNSNDEIGCSYCLQHNSFLEKRNEYSNNQFILLDELTHPEKKHLYECGTCGHKFKYKPKFIKSKVSEVRCPNCVKNNRIKQYKKDLLELYDNTIIWLNFDEYREGKDKKDKYNFECQICKRVWNGTLENVLNGNSKCCFKPIKSDESKLIYDIEEIINIEIPISTEKQNLVKCRIGQGSFRKNLIKFWKGCSVTQFNDSEILVASHIKPWSESSNKERLDVYNGFLLTPNLDKLFDKGYISFDDKGKILISKKLKDFKTLGIHTNMKIIISSKHKKYLKYHRDVKFIKK